MSTKTRADREFVLDLLMFGLSCACFLFATIVVSSILSPLSWIGFALMDHGHSAIGLGLIGLSMLLVATIGVLKVGWDLPTWGDWREPQHTLSMLSGGRRSTRR